MKKNKRNTAYKSARANASPAGYILSPSLDFWLTGGLSACVMALTLVYIFWQGASHAASPAPFVSSAITFQALLNWPHFMGAYGLLYSPKENIRKHPFAAIYVPLALAFILSAAVLSADASGVQGLAVNQDIAYPVWLVAAFYLAWHYTGQAWGMIATFAKLSGLELERREQYAIRAGLRLLLLWHVVWGAQDLPPAWLFGLSAYLPELLQIVSALCCVAFSAGLYIWWRIGKRTGRYPDRRILASWLSIYMWYLVLFFMPAAYLLVQFSHALQYLAFPLRVKINGALPPASVRGKLKPLLLGVKYYMLLLVSGMVIFYVPQYLFPSSQHYTFAVLLASAVSIHHYFVDGCIWKISNPDVRRVLFSHLPHTKSAIRAV